MRKVATVVTMAGLVALVAVAVLAQGQPQARQGRGRGAGMMGGQGMGWFGRLETTPETWELWGQLGNLQYGLHQKQWELFELQNAEPVAPEAIAAKQAEIGEIGQQMQQARQELAQYGGAGVGQFGGMAQRGQAFQQRMGMGMGMAPMGPGRMMAPTMVVADGKLYLAEGGRLYMFDANTLELVKVVPYIGPPGPPPAQ